MILVIAKMPELELPYVITADCSHGSKLFEHNFNIFEN